MSAFALPPPYMLSSASVMPLPNTTTDSLIPPLPPHLQTYQPLLKSLHSKPPRQPPPRPTPSLPPSLEQREEAELQKMASRIDDVRRWREGLQRGELGGEVPATSESVRRREEQKRLQQRRKIEQAQAAKQQHRDTEERKEQESFDSVTERGTTTVSRSRPMRPRKQPHFQSLQRLHQSPPKSDPVRVGLDADDGSRHTRQGRADVLELLESLQRSSPRPPSPLFAPPLPAAPHSIFTPSPLHPRATTPTRHTGRGQHSPAPSDEQRQRAALDRRQYLAFLNEQIAAMRTEGVTAATPRHRARPGSARGRGRGGRGGAAARYQHGAERPHTAHGQLQHGEGEEVWQLQDADGVSAAGRGRIDWSDLERQAQQLQEEWIDLQADSTLRASPLTLSPDQYRMAAPDVVGQSLAPLPDVEMREESEEEQLRRQLLARLQQVEVEVGAEHRASTTHSTTTTTRSQTHTSISRKSNSTASQKGKTPTTQQPRASKKGVKAANQMPETHRQPQSASPATEAPSYPFLQHLQQMFSVQPAFIPAAPPATVSTAQFLPSPVSYAPAVPTTAAAVFASAPPPPAAPVVIVTPPHTVVTPNLPPPAMSFTPPPPVSSPLPPPTALPSAQPAPSMSAERASVAVQAEEDTRKDAATDTIPSLFASAAERAAAPPASPHLPASLSSTRGAQTEVHPHRSAAPAVQRDPMTLSSTAAMQQAAAATAASAASSADSALEAQLRARSVQNEALVTTLEAFLARKRQHDARQAARAPPLADGDDGGLLSLLLRAFELADEKKVDEQWSAAVRREEEEAARREAEEARRRRAVEAEARRAREEEEMERRKLETERRRMDEEERRNKERAEEQQRLLAEMERRMEDKLQREKQEQEQRLQHEQELQAKQLQALHEQQLQQRQHDELTRRQHDEEARRAAEQRQAAEAERQQRLADEARRAEAERLEYERRVEEARLAEEERLRRWQGEEEARANKRREEQDEIERVRVRLLDEREEWERQRREEAREKELRMLGALKAEVESLKQQKVQMDAANDMAKRRVDAAEQRALRNSRARAGAPSESDSTEEEEAEEEDEDEEEEERRQTDSSRTDDTASTARSDGEYGATMRHAQPRLSTGYHSPGTFSPAVSLPPSPGHVTAGGGHARLPFTAAGRPPYAGVVHAPSSPGSVLLNARVAQQLTSIKRRVRRPTTADRRGDAGDVSEGAVAGDASEELSEGELSRTGQHALLGGAFVPLHAQPPAPPPRAIARPPKHRHQARHSAADRSGQESATARSAQSQPVFTIAAPVVTPAVSAAAVPAVAASAVVAVPVPLRAVASRPSSHSASASASGWEEELEKAERRLAAAQQRAERVEQPTPSAASSLPSRQRTPPPAAATPPVSSSQPPRQRTPPPTAAATTAAHTAASAAPAAPAAPSAAAVVDEPADVSRRPSVADMVSRWEGARKSDVEASRVASPARSVVHSRVASLSQKVESPLTMPIDATPDAVPKAVTVEVESAYTTENEYQHDSSVNSEAEQTTAQSQKLQHEEEEEKSLLAPVYEAPQSASKVSDESIEIEEEYSDNF